MTPQERLVNTALAEVGYLEKETNEQQDDKTSNNGNKNYTKYARDMDSITGFYNGKKQGIAWCDVFVDWCFAKTFGSETGRKLLCQPIKSSGAGCNSSMTYYKQKNQLYGYPEIGDQIFFWSSSEPDKAGHTGIVVNVTSDRVYTVEGNTYTGKEINADGGAVCKKNYVKTNARIAGYGRPDWSIAGYVENGDETEMPEYVDYMAEIVAQKGNTVNLRRNASASSDVQKAVPLHTYVAVMEHTDNKWARVSYDNGDGTSINGYMMREFLIEKKVDEDSVTRKEFEELKALVEEQRNQIMR